MVDDSSSLRPSLTSTETLPGLTWNQLSYDENYHAVHYFPQQVYRRISQQNTDTASATAQSADTSVKIAKAEKARSAKMSASDGEKVSRDLEGPREDSALSLSSALSDTDTAFSEDCSEPAEVGDGRFADFSTPPHSDVDSTYNSDRSSVSTLEGEESAHFEVGQEEEGDEEVEGEGNCSAAPDRKPDIALLLDSPPKGLKMSLEGLTLNGPVGLTDAAVPDPAAKDALVAEGNFYEDREFDFLKAEPVRRSTSLKTYKTPPGTPHRKKAVRFADVLGLDLESVRHILNLEEPPTVPQSAMKDLKVGLEEEHKTEGARYLTACFSQPAAAPNFFTRVTDEKVVLENCRVDDKDLTITGTVRVANIAFHKKVIVRYTVNNWLTFEDMCASYVQNSNDGPTDRFSFTINVPGYFGVGSKLVFAIMYSAGNATYWDSNMGKNYTVECYARALPVSDGDHAWMHFL